MTTRHDPGPAFRALHRPGAPFILANAWDAGSARLLAALGAEAIATSSAAHAFTLGRPDMGRISRDEALAHAEALVAATPLPVSGDFENGFGAAPETCAETVRLAAEAGLAGISIEDTSPPDGAAYDYELAVERIRAAVATAPVKKGAIVTIQDITVMNDFQSKALKKTFKTVVFGSLAAGPGSASAKAAPVSPHTGVPKAVEAMDVKVPKATGANARTVGEIMAKPGDAKDKPVLVRGKVVKYSGGIMGRNWIHLRDGTGSATDKTNDLLVTTTEQAKVGDVITAKGVVRVDKDFGAGYVYKALVEDAALQR